MVARNLGPDVHSLVEMSDSLIALPQLRVGLPQVILLGVNVVGVDVLGLEKIVQGLLHLPAASQRGAEIGKGRGHVRGKFRAAIKMP